MTAPHEVFSFVKKFLHLCSNGENANLSLQCEHGSVFVDLQLHLRPDYPPPRPPHSTPRPTPQPFPQPRSYPSPSRLRRSKRRAQARDRQVVKADETEKVSVNSPKDDALNKADVEVLKSEIQNINLPAEQASSDAAGNIAVILPTKAETRTPEKDVQNLSTKDILLKDDESTDTAADQSKDEVTPENGVGEVDPRINQDEYDATCNRNMKTTKPLDEEVSTPKLLNDLSREEFFDVLKNALDLSKPP